MASKLHAGLRLHRMCGELEKTAFKARRYCTRELASECYDHAEKGFWGLGADYRADRGGGLLNAEMRSDYLSLPGALKRSPGLIDVLGS